MNELDYPRTVERVVVADHGWLNVQGENDDTGLNMTGFVEAWGYTSASFTWPSGGFFEPDENANYVLLWDQAGGLSSGHYAQLWRNGTLVGYVTTQIPDYGLSNLQLLGEGAGVLAGETQGFWWSADTAMDPATMFAELFDGANGMLDLNADPTIDGVTPDNYYMEPGAGGGGGVVTGTASVTGASSGALRQAGAVAGAASVTGASAGTLRQSGAASGAASVTGSAAGSERLAATASGAASVTGASAGTLREAATVAGTAGVTGAATGVVSGSGAFVSGVAEVTGQAAGTLRAAGAIAGAAGVTGASIGTLRAAGTASGSAGVSGAATGTVTSTTVTGTASGAADVSGAAVAAARIIGAASGMATVAGVASDVASDPRHITVAGMWAEHIEPGEWLSPIVAGAYRSNVVQGEWA